jgi:hypothetical protein
VSWNKSTVYSIETSRSKIYTHTWRTEISKMIIVEHDPMQNCTKQARSDRNQTEMLTKSHFAYLFIFRIVYYAKQTIISPSSSWPSHSTISVGLYFILLSYMHPLCTCFSLLLVGLLKIFLNLLQTSIINPRSA